MGDFQFRSMLPEPVSRRGTLITIWIIFFATRFRSGWILGLFP
jgi:hypothetical protein